MRYAFLLNSVRKVLGDEATIHDAVYMWTRHKWVWPFGSAVFAGALLFAPVFGIDDWPTRTVIGAALAAVAIMAATEYRVLAQVDSGLTLLDASKIRQVATGLKEQLPRDVELSPAGGSMLASDWQVGQVRYTVPRSSENAMTRIVASRSR
ncbi:MAG: hypothetical protein HKN91_17225 [Acidimicrobiia bacterium]|nr:hypothetical protein [Acidimicrobiia bacterium]